jgi:chromosome segregation ATPase
MATKKVQNVLIDLKIQGAEKLAALKGSFRDLGKTIGQTDNDIDAARKSVNEYAKSANQSEAVVKGQIKAFEGLREQAQMGGKVYRELSDDIATLKSQLNGSTPAIDAQRKSILELASGAEVTAKQLGLAVDKLFALRNETRLDSAAFNALGKDIDGLNGKIASLAEQTKRTASENRAAALSVSNTLAKAEASAQRQIASSARREQTVRDEILALSEKKKATDELIKKENQLTAAISRRRQLSVQEGAREARRRVRAGAQVYTGAVELGPVDALDQRLGDLPNTTAAFSQRLSELQDRLVNTVRGGDQYIQVALRIAQVQREASAATQGLGAALI